MLGPLKPRQTQMHAVCGDDDEPVAFIHSSSSTSFSLSLSLLCIYLFAEFGRSLRLFYQKSI